MRPGEQPHLWPRRVIDPHIHQWDPFTTPRHSSGRARLLRPLPRVPRALGALAPRADREFVGDPHHVLKRYLPQDYRRDAGSLGVETVVHIEAAWLGADPMTSVDETRWVASLPFGVDGAPTLGAIVAHVDPRWPDVGRILDAHLAASPLVRGVRHSLAHHAGPIRSFEEAPDVAATPAFMKGFAAVAERGLSCELWVYDNQLADIVPLIDAYPETTFVLDHYATPAGRFGPRGGRGGRRPSDSDQRWREEITMISARPNVVAKHSGLGMPVLGAVPRRQIHEALPAEFVDRAAPLIRHLHDSFGVDRTMWASNYPMDKPTLSIPATARVLVDVLGVEADPDRLFREVAARTYRIAQSDPSPAGDSPDA